MPYFIDDIAVNTIYLNNVNLDDVSFDYHDPKSMIHVSSVMDINNARYTKKI